MHMKEKSKSCGVCVKLVLATFPQRQAWWFSLRCNGAIRLKSPLQATIFTTQHSTQPEVHTVHTGCVRVLCAVCSGLSELLLCRRGQQLRACYGGRTPSLAVKEAGPRPHQQHLQRMDKLNHHLAHQCMHVL